MSFILKLNSNGKYSSQNLYLASQWCDIAVSPLSWNKADKLTVYYYETILTQNHKQNHSLFIWRMSKGREDYISISEYE